MKPIVLIDVSKIRPSLTDIPTMRRMLMEILASEEEHADDLSSLLEGLTA